MRRMSFSMTEAQLLDGSKTFTRRLGWHNVQIGDGIIAIRKGMGLAKGEKQVVLGTIRVTLVRFERLDVILPTDVVKEGFPYLTPLGFVRMFCKAMNCKPHTIVTVIGFTFEKLRDAK